MEHLRCIALSRSVVGLTGVLLCIALAADLGVADDESNPGVDLQVYPDRQTGVYKVGEPIRFGITAAQDGKPISGNVAVRLLKNNTHEIQAADVALDAGKAVVAWKLDEPACLMAEVTLDVGGKPHVARSGAVADPFKIKPSLPAPQDFDAFWTRQKEKLAAVPMNPRMTPVDEPRKVGYGPEVACFDIEMDCIGGKPVRGYYVRPKGARPRSLPAVLSLHSAGIKDSSLQAAWVGAKRNQISLDINAHGLPNGKPAEFYNDLRDGELRGYSSRGMDSPESYYFYGMYMRMVRAIDFLTAQPEWDGKTVTVHGGSQGGGQSVVIAGLDSRVTELTAGVPTFCDLTRYLLGDQQGWPGRRPQNEKQQRTLRYYDACNFASRIRARATIRVGLIDRTCPPTGIIAAFNQIPTEKALIILPRGGHGGTRQSFQNAKDPSFKHSLPARE